MPEAGSGQPVRGVPGGSGAVVPTVDETARKVFARLALQAGRGAPFLLTARHESSRRGLVVQRVMTCSDVPMGVCVSLPKGHPISPLVRDSRGFGLCAIDPGDRVLLRLFERRESPSGPVAGMVPGAGVPGQAGAEGDPFISLELDTLLSGAPLVKRCLFALDLRVTMHLDFESDHEMYIGTVIGGREYAERTPAPAPAGTSAPPQPPREKRKSKGDAR